MSPLQWILTLLSDYYLMGTVDTLIPYFVGISMVASSCVFMVAGEWRSNPIAKIAHHGWRETFNDYLGTAGLGLLGVPFGYLVGYSLALSLPILVAVLALFGILAGTVSLRLLLPSLPSRIRNTYSRVKRFVQARLRNFRADKPMKVEGAMENLVRFRDGELKSQLVKLENRQETLNGQIKKLGTFQQSLAQRIQTMRIQRSPMVNAYEVTHDRIDALDTKKHAERDAVIAALHSIRQTSDDLEDILRLLFINATVEHMDPCNDGEVTRKLLRDAYAAMEGCRKAFAVAQGANTSSLAEDLVNRVDKLASVKLGEMDLDAKLVDRSNRILLAEAGPSERPRERA